MLRLGGVPEQYLRLIELQASPLKKWHADDAVDVETFMAIAVNAFSELADQVQDEVDLMDGPLAQILDGTRPVHPRYAAFDPLEPLPWQTKGPERYLARMRRLGYTL